MKIKINDLEVLDSGILIVPENNSLKFQIENSLFKEIRIQFTNEKVGDNFQFAKADNTDSLTLTIPNQIENGLPEYILIGHVSNRELFFNFSISEIEHNPKVFRYTFLIGKPINIE